MSKNATKVQIEGSDGVIIKGTLVSPPNASDYILMLHGITVDREEYLGFFSDAANDLAQHGICRTSKNCGPKIEESRITFSAYHCEDNSSGDRKSE